MLTTIKLLERKYYVRDKGDPEQIVKSLVKQINEDQGQLANANVTGKDSFETYLPVVVLGYELRYD